MYSQEQFEASFRALETDALLERLATKQLTEEAQRAAQAILRERGVDLDELPSRLHEARKDVYRHAGVTGHCDFCGKSTLGSPIVAEGQKFCSEACRHTRSLRIAAVDISDDQARAFAKELKFGPCPVCKTPRSQPDMYGTEYVTSAVFVTHWKKEWRFSCQPCARSQALKASLYCATLGWWSLYGLSRA